MRGFRVELPRFFREIAMDVQSSRRMRIDSVQESTSILSVEQIAEFRKNGSLLVPGFYDVESQIRPIQRGIYDLIGLLIRKYGLSITRKPFDPEHFDSGYSKLIAHDRALGGELYDAIKQIPAFVRLVGCPHHEQAMRSLRDTDMPAVAAGGYGIRIDNPGEEKFRAPWHQDYSAQFRSLDGVVFWSPLLAMTDAMGPVQVCVGSHSDGLVRMHTSDPNNPEKSGAYALILENEAERVGRYGRIAPLTSPGDLLLMDFLTIHRSGRNLSDRSRWSMQMRYFNFREPTGQKIKWSGAYAANVDIRSVHPELYID